MSDLRDNAIEYFKTSHQNAESGLDLYIREEVTAYYREHGKPPHGSKREFVVDEIKIQAYIDFHQMSSVQRDHYNNLYKSSK